LAASSSQNPSVSTMTPTEPPSENASSTELRLRSLELAGSRQAQQLETTASLGSSSTVAPPNAPVSLDIQLTVLLQPKTRLSRPKISSS